MVTTSCSASFQKGLTLFSPPVFARATSWRGGEKQSVLSYLLPYLQIFFYQLISFYRYWPTIFFTVPPAVSTYNECTSSRTWLMNYWWCTLMVGCASCRPPPEVPLHIAWSCHVGLRLLLHEPTVEVCSCSCRLLTLPRNSRHHTLFDFKFFLF